MHEPLCKYQNIEQKTHKMSTWMTHCTSIVLCAMIKRTEQISAPVYEANKISCWLHYQAYYHLKSVTFEGGRQKLWGRPLQPTMLCRNNDGHNEFTISSRHAITLCQTIYSALMLTLKVLVATIDAQWEGMGDVGSARYEPALLPPCPTIRVLSYSN